MQRGSPWVDERVTPLPGAPPFCAPAGSGGRAASGPGRACSSPGPAWPQTRRCTSAGGRIAAPWADAGPSQSCSSWFQGFGWRWLESPRWHSFSKTRPQKLHSYRQAKKVIKWTGSTPSAKKFLQKNVRTNRNWRPILFCVTDKIASVHQNETALQVSKMQWVQHWLLKYQQDFASHYLSLNIVVLTVQYHRSRNVQCRKSFADHLKRQKLNRRNIFSTYKWSKFIL